MNPRKAFFFFGFMVLVWSIFWQGAIRVWSLRHSDSNWAKGMLINL